MTDDATKRVGKSPTLEDVAAHAGVSRALVSLVIRGAPGPSAQSRERVLRAAEEVGYRPDARARLLARGSSRLIGVVFGMAGTFHFELLDGLYTAAEGAGYEVILSALTPGRAERRAVETLLDFRCEAVILLGPESPRPVLAGRLPVVVVGWQVKDESVDVVRTSDDEGMRQAVDHLAGLGHRDIVHVDGGAGRVSVARRRGYRNAMRKHGLGEYVRVIQGGLTQDEGAAVARVLLDQESLPTAVVAYNDDVATGLLETFVRAGVAVPADVSIVGWDDSHLSRLPHVNLTTVRQDADQMARLAVERAVERLKGLEVAEGEIVLPPRLVVRGSTGSPGTSTHTRKRGEPAGGRAGV